MLNITIAYMNMSKKIKYVKRKNYYNLNHKFYCMRVCVCVCVFDFLVCQCDNHYMILRLFVNTQHI